MVALLVAQERRTLPSGASPIGAFGSRVRLCCPRCIDEQGNWESEKFSVAGRVRMPVNRRSIGRRQVCSAARSPPPMCTGGRGVGLPATPLRVPSETLGREPAGSDMRHIPSGARGRLEDRRDRCAAGDVAGSHGRGRGHRGRCPHRRPDTVDRAVAMRGCSRVKPASPQLTRPFWRACTPSPDPCPVSRCAPPSVPCAGPAGTSCTGACYGSTFSSAWPRAASSRTPSAESRRFRDRVLTLRQSLTWILALTFAT